MFIIKLIGSFLLMKIPCCYLHFKNYNKLIIILENWQKITKTIQYCIHNILFTKLTWKRLPIEELVKIVFITVSLPFGIHLCKNSWLKLQIKKK